jgi:hypothetical protein
MIPIGELSKTIKSMTNEIEHLGSAMSKKELHQLPSALRAKMKSIHETCNIHKTFERNESKRTQAEERFKDVVECKYNIEHHKRIMPHIQKKESVCARIARCYKNMFSERVSSKKLYDLYHPFGKEDKPLIETSAKRSR